MNKTILIALIIPCLIISYFYYKKYDYKLYQSSTETHILALIFTFISSIYLLSKKCITNDYLSVFLIGFIYTMFGFHVFYQLQLEKVI